jgi:membrane-bound ClpP family serine protease
MLAVPDRVCRQMILVCVAWAAMLLLSPAAFAQEKPAPAAAASSQPAAIPAGRQASKVAIITIHDEIDEKGVMAHSVKRRIDQAAAAGYDAIVFDIDCPGGEVAGVLDICNYIKSAPITNTIAWVHPTAYSGAAVIALACREIVVDAPCSFGDAMPITIGQDRFGRMGTKALDAEAFRKYMGPLVAEVVESARRYNSTFGGYLRDEYLLESIVANDVELWWVRNKETGVRMAVDKEEFEMLFPGESTGGPARLGHGGTAPIGPAVEHGAGAGANFPTGSNKLAGVAGAVEKRIEQQSGLKTDRPRVAAADAGKWELLGKISDGSMAATFKADDMLYYGLCANDTQVVNGKTMVAPIHTDQDVATFLGARSVRRADMNWSEYMVDFLTNTIVRGILIVIFLVALFIEMTHPGAIVPGLCALVALVVLLAPPLLIGMAAWWEVLAILGGLVLLALEAFVIPGFGVAGVLGLILLFAGLVGTFVPSGGGFGSPQGQSDMLQSDMLWGATTVLLAGATAALGMWSIAKHFGSLPVLGRLVLKDPNVDEESEAILAAMDPDEGAEVRVGEIGTALTPLRPAGRVDMGDRVVDAISEFGFIPVGAKVRIVSANQMRIGVEEVREKA